MTAHRRVSAAADTGSLPLAVLLTLVGVAASALLVPVVLAQFSTTRNSTGRVNALNAAQAGLDVALGHIRAAVDASGAGVVAELPCGPLSGRVGAAATARYEVTIDYLSADPVGQSAAWVAANRIACSPATGPATLPGYALLTALGTNQATGQVDTVAHRALRATYVFKVSGQSTAGGLVHVYKTATSTDLCLDAGATAPAAGSHVQLQPCDAADAQQKFAYDANLTLVLAASRTALTPLGMCLDAGTPQASGRVLQFQPCASVTRAQQQWILNDQANFEGTTDGSTPSGYCFNVQTPDTPGSFLVLGSVAGGTCRGGYDLVQTFAPETAVGVGAAGALAGQVVDYGQVGRCLAVAEGYPYLVAWPCQQSPDPANVGWTQRWTLPVPAAGATSGTGVMSTASPAGQLCLRSPGSTAAGQYVAAVACPPGAPARAMTWTVHADTGAYTSSYTVTDADGHCLVPTDPDARTPDLHPVGQRTSKIVVAGCDGSAAQKWNAPAAALRSLALENVAEA